MAEPTRLPDPGVLIATVRHDIVDYSIDMAIQILAVLREQYVTLALTERRNAEQGTNDIARSVASGQANGYTNAWKLVDAAIADLRNAQADNDNVAVS